MGGSDLDAVTARVGGRRWLATLGWLLAVWSASLPAQQVRADELAARQAAAPRSTLAWFELGLALVEAQCDVDARAALATARELAAAAASRPVVGAVEASAAAVAATMAMVEGPVAAREWFAQSAAPPVDTPPSLAASCGLFRAQYHCLADDHVAEVEEALEVQEAAIESGDPVLRLRVSAVSGHVAPERGLAELRRGLAELRATGQSANVEHLQPLVDLEDRNLAAARGDDAATAALDQRLLAAATALGNRRLLACTTANLAGTLVVQGRKAEALPLYDRVEELYQQLGERRALFGVQSYRALLALADGDLDAAKRRIEQVRALVEDRGLAGPERGLLQLRFEYAVRTHDAALADELKRRMNQIDLEIEADDRRAEQLRHRVANAVAAKEAAEAALQRERVLAAERAGAARNRLALGAIVALGLLTGLAFWSRRRLATANARLADQMRQLQASQAAQHQLEARTRELERTQSLGTMAAGVAHDFNNLLTSILGNAELLGSQSHGVSASRVQAILAAGEQAARLCRHLQSYAGGTPTRPAQLDLAGLVEAMLPALRVATDGQLELRHIGDGTAVGALADRAQVEQALLNLTLNARDAGATRVDFAVTTGADGRAELSVRDNGQGMTEAVQQRIFDPFFTTRFPGRGLGLAVVHGVVRRHDGEIAVESTPGQGATFRIRLPGTAAPAPTVLVPRPAAAPVPCTATAVVVDDEPGVRDVLVQMLVPSGMTLSAWDDGPAALAAVAALPADRRLVAFVDLTMPGMDGPEVVRQVRRLRPDATIVLMSGHPAAYLEQMARETEPDHVLQKPFSLTAVSAVVAALALAPPAEPAPNLRPAASGS